ncbi:MAG: polysaccharide deacetylase family protein [Gemmatimonadota bacterium]
MKGRSLPGALVISLDFELHWGVRDRVATSDPYVRNLLGGREAIPRLLDTFDTFDIAATWATVGFLFASSRRELEDASPTVRPSYVETDLSPYGEQIGDSEADDPLHFAPSLIELIGRTSRQEIATHTFSHFYCGEKGQDKEAFRADIEAARAIAARKGIRLQSIVFPRNQHNPRYDEILLANGITAYRGTPDAWAWRFDNGRQSRAVGKRAGRALDTYVNLFGHGTTSWARVLQPSGLSNIRASRLLAPHRPGASRLESLRLQRICEGIHSAARAGEIFHLWWHPHNFGSFLHDNLVFLRKLLAEFVRARERYGMLSVTMTEVDDLVRLELGESLPSRSEGNPGESIKSHSLGSSHG